MRRIQTLLENKNIIPENILAFPFDRLITAPWGAMILVYFIDSLNGNDSNDGRTLATAKKTFQALLDSMTHDLLFHEARIFIHSGLYENTGTYPVANFEGFANGTIKIDWLGTWANPDDPEYTGNDSAQWLYNLLGGVPVRDNNQVVFSAKNCSYDAIFLGGFQLINTCAVLLESCNFGKAWDAVGANYAFRFKFQQDETEFNSNLFELISTTGLKQFSIMQPIEMDLTNVKMFGIFLNSPIARLGGAWMYTRELCPINTGTSYWSGYVAFGDQCTKLCSLENVWYPSNGWASGFGLFASGKLWKIEGCTHFVNFHTNSAGSFSLGANIIIEQGELPAPVLPQITFQANSEPKVTYNSDLCSLNDLTLIPHFTKDTKTNQENYFIGGGLKKFEDNFIVGTSNSGPTDLELSPNDVCFFLDIVGHKLKVKVNEAGTIKTGEINLV